jgi:hypothetical protein
VINAFNDLLTTPRAALTIASCVPKKPIEISTEINAADALISLLIMMLKPQLKQAYDLIQTLVRPYLLNSS